METSPQGECRSSVATFLLYFVFCEKRLRRLENHLRSINNDLASMSKSHAQKEKLLEMAEARVEKNKKREVFILFSTFIHLFIYFLVNFSTFVFLGSLLICVCFGEGEVRTIFFFFFFPPQG